ncbi:ABC transporter ATP-binding protein [Pelotomaculum propionicicum]|uniref:Fe(3+) dicitrate transport ATP-binding protein FecE n=1 Tax=Pelotomaculum propionicicum TaxID=258475 RepID=A0A4Y7RT58_9FIRM|nr:ABC transporter ATP-binding protein [Pelotomaculum propionicicum]TEB11936.1 Fe(3+) dicitrate transport ATP-binding protein FecE [Pelotomaculum propionicicum]
MEKAVLMQTENLNLYYGKTPALQAVSLSIREGGFYGILGPNGSGKTTLISVMCGVLKPSSGRVLWNGRELGSYNRGQIARSFAVVPQDYAINFPFTVLEVVMMGRKPHLGRLGRPSDEDLEIVYTCMENCGVLDYAGKVITNLSGGERQRVILARALAQTPQVLFLDEATSNLDISHKIELLKLIKRLNAKQGVTVIAALHDLNFAGMFCDYMIYLDKGRVACEGPTAVVFNEEVINRVFNVEVEIRKHAVTGRYNLALLPDLR